MRRFIVLSIVGLFLVVVAAIALVPVWMEARIEDELATITGAPAQVDEVWLNLFDGEITIEGISLIQPQLTLGELRVDIAYLPLLDRTLRVEAVTVARLELQLAAAGGQVQLPALQLAEGSDAASSAPPWHVEIQSASLRDARIRVEDPAGVQELRIDSLTLSNFIQGDETPFPVRLDGAFDDAALGFDGTLQLLPGAQKLSGVLELDALALDRLASWLPVAVTGDLTLNQLQVVLSHGAATEITATGAVAIASASAHVADLDAAAARLEWMGTVEAGLPEAGDVSVRITGDLHGSGLRAGADTPLAQLGALEVAGIEFEFPGATRVATVRATDLDVNLERNEQGFIVGLPATSQATRGEAPGDAAAAPGITIDSIEIDGESRAAFTDRSVTPPVMLEITDVRFSGSHLDTGTPLEFTLAAHQGEAGELAATGRLTGILAGLPQGSAGIDFNAFDLPLVASYIDLARIRSGRADLHTDVEMDQEEIRLNNHVLINQLRIDAAEDGGGDGLPLSVALNLLKDADDRIELDVPIVSGRDQLAVDPRDVIQVALQNATKKAAVAYAAIALQPFGSLLLLKNMAASAGRPRLAALEFPPARQAVPDGGREYVNKLAALLKDRPNLQLTLCGIATLGDKTRLEEDLLAKQQAERAKKEAEAPDIVGEIAAEIRESLPAPQAPQVTDDRLEQLATARRKAVVDALAGKGVDPKRLLGCRAEFIGDQSAPRVEFLL